MPGENHVVVAYAGAVGFADAGPLGAVAVEVVGYVGEGVTRAYQVYPGGVG